MSQIAHYSKALTALLPTVTTDTFAQHLIDFLKELVPFNDATVVVYPAGELPIIDYFQPHEDGSSHLNQFVQAAFLLDPYYQTGAAGKFGFFNFQNLAPEGFKESEYYRTYYCRSGYHDECGYLISTGGDSFVNISLARTNMPVLFSHEQLTLLQDITPLIEYLCAQHWRRESLPTKGESNLRVQLHSALEDFGSSLLTGRETQVINLILHGFSTKMVAEKLCISLETVKLHRKNAYAKMEISSQAELFYLFIASLMNANKYAGGDPLEAYLQPPPEDNREPAE